MKEPDVYVRQTKKGFVGYFGEYKKMQSTGIVLSSEKKARIEANRQLIQLAFNLK